MNTLPTDYQSFIATSRYARWLDAEKRRETWGETVDRYINNVVVPKIDDIDIVKELRSAIVNLEVTPSMRAMMTAGPALDRDNTCAYNCSYLPVDDPRSFDEAMFILLCGTGVGFSVERQFISQLPQVPSAMFKVDDIIVVEDNKEGWSDSLRQLIAYLYSGKIPGWDTHKVRKAGAKLKTFGGRASGPGPLVELFNFVIATFVNAKGRQLNSLECHDIMCKIGEVVVVGGVRRSAMISLSNLFDNLMRYAKSGQWWELFGFTKEIQVVIMREVSPMAMERFSRSALTNSSWELLVQHIQQMYQRLSRQMKPERKQLRNNERRVPHFRRGHAPTR